MPARSASPWLVVLGLAASLGLPATALADQVVVPPLVPRGATQMRDVANITQLLGSELDFMREVESVVALDKVPDGYGYSCLDRAPCLRTIGQEQGATHVLAGWLRVSDTQVEMELVYFSVDTGRFVRRQSFELPNSPEQIADNMGDIAQEMVTGQAPGGDDATAEDDIDLLDFDEDFEVDFDKDDFAEAQATEAEERARREEEARRRAEEERRRQAELEEQRRREEEARRRAELEEQRRREAEEARLAALEDEPEPEFDPNAISFGSADIVVEETEEDEPEPEILSSEPDTTDYYEDDEPLDLDSDEPVVADLDLDEDRDEDRRKPAREKKPRTPRSKGSGAGFDDSPTSVAIALRGGYSPYYSLGFVTYGAEAQLAVADTGVHVLGGFQGWSVQRDIPEEFQRLAGATREWNTMFPVNLGAVYKVSVADGRVKPYGGADLVFARYYAGEEGSGMGSIAVGARARGGVDVMIVRNFGLTADLAIGGWGGGDWVIIEEGVKNAGLLPQFSAGTVLAF